MSDRSCEKTLLSLASRQLSRRMDGGRAALLLIFPYKNGTPVFVICTVLDTPQLSIWQSHGLSSTCLQLPTPNLAKLIAQTSTPRLPALTNPHRMDRTATSMSVKMRTQCPECGYDLNKMSKCSLVSLDHTHAQVRAEARGPQSKLESLLGADDAEKALTEMNSSNK